MERDEEEVDGLTDLSVYMQCFTLPPEKSEYMLKYHKKNV